MPVAIFNNDTAGPTVEIGVSQHDNNIIPGNPPASTVWVKAIADTGAAQTCICASVAMRASLPIIGIAQMQSASHVVPANLYFGTLWLRGFVGGTVFQWNFPARVFMELCLPGATHEGLLGMDIFSQGLLLVNGIERKTSFSW